jgi:hypothetical protein
MVVGIEVMTVNKRRKNHEFEFAVLFERKKKRSERFYSLNKNTHSTVYM